MRAFRPLPSLWAKLLLANLVWPSVSFAMQSAPIDIDIDQGAVDIKLVETGGADYTYTPPAACHDLKPKVEKSANRLAIKSGSNLSCNGEPIKISLTLPKRSKINIAVGTGGIKLSATSSLTRTYGMSATVGVGSIESTDKTIKVEKVALASFAETPKKDRQIDLTLGTGTIKFE